MSTTPTTTEYGNFQSAFDFFNEKLFSGSRLPNILITLTRHPKSKGYFSPNRFQKRNDGDVKTHELALNPDVFVGRSDEGILSTLAHEMVHLWQQSHGKPPRIGYHDRQWATKMESVGLIPTDTGNPGGKRTGQKVTHYIADGGAYQVAYLELQATGFILQWQSPEETKQKGKPKKLSSKTKFTCPKCGDNMWGKPDSAVVCVNCMGEDDVSGLEQLGVSLPLLRPDGEFQPMVKAATAGAGVEGGFDG